jgi:OOP family OmpA-OmpF porin
MIFAPSLKTIKPFGMKKIILITALIFSSATFVHSQLLKKIANKVKGTVENRTVSAVDKEVNKTIDEIEGKNTSISTGSEQTNARPNVENNSITSYSKYDFVPGDTVLYAEDFANEAIGELPVNWNSSGKGEVVTLNNQTGNWLKLFANSNYLTANTKAFTKNFTVEFDVLFQLKNTGSAYPVFAFGMLSGSELSPNDNDLLSNFSKYQSAILYTRLAANGLTYTYLQSHLNSKKYFFSDQQKFPDLEKSYNSVSHVAIQVQEKRYRVWINGEKKYDVPMALSTDFIFNQLFFRVTPFNDPQFGFYVSNIKVATGLADTRHKLIEEGKFSTTGILFDVNSANIKPESNGVLKEIADALTKYPDFKVKIIGHTDSDGSDPANLTLSQKRAAAVKEALVKDFSISESRIVTEGKGETKPVADNKTKEGKMQNRRVEFVKQ